MDEPVSKVRVIGHGAKRARTVAAMIMMVVMLATAMAAASAAVAAEAPRWVIVAAANPTNLAPNEPAPGGHPPQLIVTAVNVGGASTDGSTITLGDSLSSDLTGTAVSGYDLYGSGRGSQGGGSVEMTCSSGPVVCVYSGVVDPGDTLEMAITLKVGESLASSIPNLASVSGGGAATASTETPVTISTTPASFGPTPGSVFTASSTDQAGAHANVTVGYRMNTSAFEEVPVNHKDVSFDLPPGFVGNAVGMPRCTMHQIIAVIEGAKPCPADTMVGMVTLTLGSPVGQTLATPLYNIAPAPGEPVALGFDGLVLPVRLDTSVLSDGNYGVRVTASNVAETVNVLATTITTWGVPADHSGPGGDLSVYNVFFGGSFGGPNPGQTRVPFLSNPQQCSQPLSAEMLTDPWTSPGAFVSSGPVAMGTLSGCEQLSLESSFSMLPDTLQAGAPAGYAFKLNVPQSNEPDGLATPNVKDVKLTLPLGTVVNPSAAWGLKACSNTAFFGPPPREQRPAQLGNCPREAQVGKVRIKTPALEEQLEGQVYLAEPECDPCTPEDAKDGKMVRLFLQAVSEGEGGIIVKLEGHGEIDQKTGQITTVFENNPQLPFDKLELVLGGGPRAVLANPRSCGAVTSNLDVTPWSTPFTSDSTPFDGFEINQDCFGPQFSPSFVAGMPNIQAGSYSPFTLAFGRSDHDQFLAGISTQMPPGLLGRLSGVELCREPQASLGTCGPNSLLGHVQVLTGPGADPFLVPGGQVFLTEGYKGAPYGLSIVVPAVAGPYTLSGTTGHGTVVVRAKILVDPHTAALTVTSDPLPTMLDGIPLQLKAVNVTIDRPGFTFNPTNCNKSTINGTLTSAEGMSATVSTPFQVTNCAALKFAPKFSVSTSGKTSKVNGASLTAKLSYPNAPQGTQANITRVKVDLPKQLPSRLTTLQKACTAAVFNANPASCPAASVIGSARAVTPVLPVPLSGPVYFVSHGGEAFPSLVAVLQGYGTTVDLEGTTFISKAGITSSTFKTVPDVPVETFELTLPEGKYSALAANGNLCTSKLAMPTEFLAQNGLKITQSTPISVTGCAKAKALTRAQKLAVALKACNKKAKSKQAACRVSARKRYGPQAKQKTKSKAKKKK